MKFLISKGFILFDKLQNLKKRMQEVNKQATDLVESLGYSNYCRAHHRLAGGIAAIQIPKAQKPDGWARATTKHTDLFMPKKQKANKELLQKIDALPELHYNELNDLLNFKTGCSTSLVWHVCPGVIWKNEYILVEISEQQNYTPVDGMVEILESEFKRLKDN